MADQPAMDWDVHGGLPPRKVLHLDQDAFFASVEQRDDPSLRGRPVAVGGSRERGVVAAASYEARKFGIHSAMPAVTARRRCPDLVFVKPRFDVYREVSGTIREIFLHFTALVEPLSLDEAYLDVTEDARGLGTATDTAREIKRRIKEETGLTASAGVSYNKFLAKMASGHRKPDGLYVIRPDQGPGFVSTLPVAKFHGVGPSTAQKLAGLGIVHGHELRDADAGMLERHFGVQGARLKAIAHGVDTRLVTADRERKSVGAETTFDRDLVSVVEMREAIPALVEKVWGRCARGETTGRTVTLKIKFHDFEQVTRSRSLPRPVDGAATLLREALALLDANRPERPVRLLGVQVSALGDEDASQPELPGLSP